MSSTIMQVVRHAKQQAARHGSLFVNPDHLVLGLLQTQCAPLAVLHHFQVDYEAARTMIDGRVVIPVNTQLALADVDLSPQSRDLLMFAQECAAEQGSNIMGTAHLTAVLLHAPGSPLRHMLEVRQANVRDVESQVLGTWPAHPEDAGSVVPMEQQVAQLREDYKRMAAEQGQSGPVRQSRGSAVRDPSTLSQSPHDDIYE